MATNTEKLRGALDDCGIDHADAKARRNAHITTWVGDNAVFCYTEDGENVCELHVDGCTPEQAVRATRETRDYTYEQWRAVTDAISDAMGYAHDKAAECDGVSDPLWNLDDYVKRVLNATFGTTAMEKTCEMVYCPEGWEDPDGRVWWTGHWQCDTCGGHVSGRFPNPTVINPPGFCPNCGARVVKLSGWYTDD